MTARIPALATLAAALAIAVVLAIPRGDAAAQTPPGSGGGFSGVPPRFGGIALLVTTEASTPTALAEVLADAGCDVGTISSLEAGAWSSFVSGAPGFVNEPAPAFLPADTPFSVRCAPIAIPILNPEDATYDLDGGSVTLVDGESSTPAAPGSATNILTTLSTRQSYAYLDGDAVADAASILSYQPGGTGTFSYLSVILSGSTSPAPTMQLGDRITIERLAAGHGRIVVTYLDRNPGEPFAATPTVPMTRTFVVEAGALVEIGTGVCEAANLGAIGSFVFVTTPVPGDRVGGGFTVEGCSRTFESTVNWRLLDREGLELASGFTMGGGVDGPARFSFTVTYDTLLTTEEVGTLEVFEEDASSGEGFPPPRVVIPLILP